MFVPQTEIVEVAVGSTPLFLASKHASPPGSGADTLSDGII
jgi:hypothetical protein